MHSARMLQDRGTLLQRHAREPLHKLGRQRTVFKIFKQRCHGHGYHGNTHAPLRVLGRAPPLDKRTSQSWTKSYHRWMKTANVRVV